MPYKEATKDGSVFIAFVDSRGFDGAMRFILGDRAVKFLKMHSKARLGAMKRYFEFLDDSRWAIEQTRICSSAAPIVLSGF